MRVRSGPGRTGTARYGKAVQGRQLKSGGSDAK
jgi:hypothetical protein